MIKVYVKVDSNGIVTEINSDAFLHDVSGWVQLDEGDGDRYYHAQGNYLSKSLINDDGLFRYKIVNGCIEERTLEELSLDLSAVPEPKLTDAELLLETVGNHEYRLCLMELGMTEDDL